MTPSRRGPQTPFIPPPPAGSKPVPLPPPPLGDEALSLPGPDLSAPDSLETDLLGSGFMGSDSVGAAHSGPIPFVADSSAMPGPAQNSDAPAPASPPSGAFGGSFGGSFGAAPRREQVLPEVEEHTVLARRKKKKTRLLLPDGKIIPLEADTVVIGRKLEQADFPVDVQLINVADPTRTVSKFHATLFRELEGWTIRDENSTNGIYVMASDGSEVEVEGEGPVHGTFILGDLEFQLEIGS